MRSLIFPQLSMDCRGLQSIGNLAWDMAPGPEDTSGHMIVSHGTWGFLIYREVQDAAPGSSPTRSRFWGAIGPIAPSPADGTCLAIPIHGIEDSRRALIQFILACGLSILEDAQLEMGDTLVISGINPLALCIIAAAQARGSSRILCLVPSSEARAPLREQAEKAVLMTTDFAYSRSFDYLFDEFLASSTGETAFFDTTGDPNLIYSMATRLKTYGKMVLCRQDAKSSVMMNICNFHHLKSAHYIYWSRVESPEDALQCSEHVLRAGRLLDYKRLPVPILDLFRFYPTGADTTIQCL